MATTLIREHERRALAMAERPGIVAGAILVLALIGAAALLGALAEAGTQGAAGIGAVGAGLVSGCVRFALESRHLPPALVVVTALGLASAAAFLRAVRSLWRERRLVRELPVVALGESEYAGLLSASDGAGVYVLRSRRRSAFCAGLFRPRVVVTTVLLRELCRRARRRHRARTLSPA